MRKIQKKVANIRIQKPRVVILAGAGLSIDAGMPGAIGLCDDLRKYLETERDYLIPILNYIHGAYQFGIGCQNRKPESELDIEAVVGAASLLAKRDEHSLFPFVGSWHSHVEQLSKAGPNGQDPYEEIVRIAKQSLKRWLGKGRYTDFLTRVKYLLEFRNIAEKWSPLHVFSLNYDLCIEAALDRESTFKWTRGFDESGWKPDLLENEENSLFLYKLHGSLDWVKDKRLGIISLEYPKSLEAEMISDDYDPFLILGQDKLKTTDPFLTFFYKLHRHLNAADVIVCIGYSFRDFHINDVLLEALGNRNTTCCLVVDPEGLKSLNHDKRFERLVNVESRFFEISNRAKDALVNDVIQKEIEKLIYRAQGENEIF